MSSPTRTSETVRVPSRAAAVSILIAIAVGLAVGSTRLSADNPHGADAQSAKTVRCNAGQSINSALQRAEAGATLHVRGLCHERVVITQAVTLDGGGSAVIDGSGITSPVAPAFDGVVVVDGVTGVALMGLRIQNGTGNGVVASHGAAIVLRNVNVVNNGQMGLSIEDNSTAEVVDSESRFNGVSGFDVFTGSSLVLKGAFTTANNSANGGEINGESIVELRGAQVTANDNPQFGIIAGSTSHLAIFGWEGAKGSTLTASGNGIAGIGVVGDSSLTTYSDTLITAANNRVGFFLNAGGKVAAPPFAGATFVLHNNGVGMSLASGSSMLITAGLNVHDNGVGVVVDEGALSLAALPGLTASIAANGIDVQLSFGTRSTIENVSVATPLVCEANVLSRGTTTCP